MAINNYFYLQVENGVPIKAFGHPQNVSCMQFKTTDSVETISSLVGNGSERFKQDVRKLMDNIDYETNAPEKKAKVSKSKPEIKEEKGSITKAKSS